jgi:putative phage-type endonuclease
MSAQPKIMECEQNTPEWLEERTKYIGSSDAPIIAGYSSFKSPIDLAQEKKIARTSNHHPDPETKQQHRGHALEPLVGEIYSMQTGALLIPGKSYIHPNGIMAASLDFETFDYTSIVEAKTHYAYQSGNYPESGTPDGVSNYEMIQCQHQMYVAGRYEMNCAVLFGDEKAFDLLVKMLDEGADVRNVAGMVLDIGMDFRAYPIIRNETLIEALVELELEFWNKYVLGDEIPCDIRYMEPVNGLRTATDAEEKIVNYLKTQWMIMNRAKSEVDRLKDELKMAIGENEGLESAQGKITYRKPKSNAKTNWQKAAERCFESMTTSEREEILKECEEIPDLSRRLNLPVSMWKKDL